MDIHSVAQGRTLRFLAQLRDEDGQPVVGSYTGAEPLTLEVWPGGRRLAVALAASGIEWGGTDRGGTAITAGDGVVTVRIDDSDTAVLDPGTYRLTASVID